MAGDRFQTEIDWVQSLVGDDKVKAGSVMSWQATASTLNELVKHFNAITFSSDAQGAPTVSGGQLGDAQ